MAISDAMRYRMNTGGSAEDLYATIRDFLASSPDAATTQAAMAQYGISGEDVANATGGKSGGLLSGNILSGASWNSLNTALPEQLTQATGQATSNYAVGGATTADTLNQLNTYLAGGGQFDPNATVFLQTGGVDFLQGVDKGTIKDNINQIVKTLGDQGVNVVLTGSPYAASINDVVTNNFDPKVDPLFNEIAKENKNVALVGVQGEILQNKKLLVDALHTNAEGTAIYNQAVIDSLSQFKNDVPSSTPEAIKQVQTSNVVATTPAQITQIAQTGQTMAANPTVKDLIKSGVFEANGNQPVLINGTYYQPIFQQIGSGMDAQQGPLENVVTYKADENKVGGDVNWFSPEGEKQQVTKQQEVNATKDFMDFALTAGTMFGLPTEIGKAIGLGSGAVSQAVGQGLLTTGTKLAGGDTVADALKAGLIGGGLVYGGNQLGDLVNQATYDSVASADTAGGLIPKYGTNYQDIVSNLVDNPEAQQALQNLINGTSTPVAVSTPVVDGAISSATENLVVTAPKVQTPVNVGNVFATTPTLTITGKAPTTPTTQQDVINTIAAVNSNIAGTPTATTPELVIKGATTPKTTIGDTLAAITTLPTTSTTTTPDKPKETDPLKVAQLALAAAGLLTAGGVLSNTSTPTGFDIVPIPEDWKTPPKTGVAPFTPLPPINFGDRNLLIGTQWEKFLDPNYGKVPEPVKYSQPSSMSYNDLMSILGSKQGYPSSRSLSINDIISGIQNQYGQAPVSTMG